jgi:hypothetical protein
MQQREMCARLPTLLGLSVRTLGLFAIPQMLQAKEFISHFSGDCKQSWASQASFEGAYLPFTIHGAVKIEQSL